MFHYYKQISQCNAFNFICLIGKNGVEKVIELQLNSEEKTMFDNSAEAVKKLVAEIKL